MEITIYTDGASRGNPGHSAYGFVIKNDKNVILFEEGKYIGIATNNFAEYSAILCAIEYVKHKFKNPADLSINFLMDSKLAVEQLSGRFKIKNIILKGFFTQIIGISRNFKKVSYTHIPRHLNWQADRLANMALDSL